MASYVSRSALASAAAALAGRIGEAESGRPTLDVAAERAFAARAPPRPHLRHLRLAHSSPRFQSGMQPINLCVIPRTRAGCEALLRDGRCFDEPRRLQLLTWCTALTALPPQQ